MAQKVLVVDDETAARDALAGNLRSNGYTVVTVPDAAGALPKARAESPALILLDLMHSGRAGLELCRELKSESTTRDIPVIFVTARAEEIDKVVALELGADDYITKPFSPRELILRVKRSLRRSAETLLEASHLRVGDLTLDIARHEVRAGGRPVDLTATEFKLLALLMERRGRVQERSALLNDVWGYETAIDTRTVDTHMRRLREKLGAAADFIQTVRGVGYRISDAAVPAGRS